MRGIRARMELRAGRFSTTSTGISALRSPDRSARRISSVSKRSCPKRQCRARGADRLPAQRLHAVGVGHRQPEADPQQRGEHAGDRPPLPVAGVVRTGRPLRADDHRRPVGRLDHAARPGRGSRGRRSRRRSSRPRRRRRPGARPAAPARSRAPAATAPAARGTRRPGGWRWRRCRRVDPFSTTTISNDRPRSRSPAATSRTDSSSIPASLWAGRTTVRAGGTPVGYRPREPGRTPPSTTTAALAALSLLCGWLALRPASSGAAVETAPRPLWAPDRLPALLAEAQGTVDLERAVDRAPGPVGRPQLRRRLRGGAARPAAPRRPGAGPGVDPEDPRRPPPPSPSSGPTSGTRPRSCPTPAPATARSAPCGWSGSGDPTLATPGVRPVAGGPAPLPAPTRPPRWRPWPTA